MAVLLGTLAGGQSLAFAQTGPEVRYFPETKQSLAGRFLEYWTLNGGLMQQGYPISPLLEEQSAIDGKTYDVQYFERAVFEMHPENQRPNDVLLSLLGVLAYRDKYPNGAPGQVANNDPGSIFFPETGKRLGGSFLIYFMAHGGVPQQGLPISDEFNETSPLDGKTRVVQYFERAVFEWNPSNQPPYNVLLSQLGTFAYKAKNTPPPPTPTPEPPLPDTVIPAPAGGGQYGPSASNHYLVWGEGVVRTGSGPIYGSFDIHGLDLRTNKVITVTNAVGDQDGAVVDGDLAAWRSITPNNNCIGCIDPGVYAKDLSTGKEYTVAANVYADYSIGVSGRKVAWIQGSPTGQRLMIKDVDTNATTLVREIPTENPTLTGIKMSGNYLVWHERAFTTESQPDLQSFLKVYDLTSGKTSNVLAYTRPTQGAFSLNYAVGGHRIVVQTINNTTFVADMAALTTTSLPYYGYMTNVVIQGDVVLFGRDKEGTDIVGMNLARQDGIVDVVRATPDGYSRYQFTMVGGRVIYVDASDAPGRGIPTLQVRALPDYLK
jgi:hypothetical protein